MVTVFCGRNRMNNFINSNPFHISFPIHECQPSNTLYTATVKWCHWECIYVDWLQDFNGMSSSCSKCFQTVFHMCTCYSSISLFLPRTFTHFLHLQHCTDQCCILSAHSRQNCWKGSSYVPSTISDEEGGIWVLCRFGMIPCKDTGIIPLSSETVSYMKACSIKGVSLHAINFLVLYCYWYSFISYICFCMGQYTGKKEVQAVFST
jgi:hypothetical protein